MLSLITPLFARANARRTSRFLSGVQFCDSCSRVTRPLRATDQRRRIQAEAPTRHLLR